MEWQSVQRAERKQMEDVLMRMSAAAELLVKTAIGSRKEIEGTVGLMREMSTSAGRLAVIANQLQRMRDKAT